MAEIIGYDEDGNPIYGYGEAVPTPTQNAQPAAGPDMAADTQTYQAQPETYVPPPDANTQAAQNMGMAAPATDPAVVYTEQQPAEIAPPASTYTETSYAPEPVPPPQGSPNTPGVSQYYGAGASVNGTVTPRSVKGVSSLSGSSSMMPNAMGAASTGYRLPVGETGESWYGDYGKNALGQAARGLQGAGLLPSAMPRRQRSAGDQVGEYFGNLLGDVRDIPADIAGLVTSEENRANAIGQLTPQNPIPAPPGANPEIWDDAFWTATGMIGPSPRAIGAVRGAADDAARGAGFVAEPGRIAPDLAAYADEAARLADDAPPVPKPPPTKKTVDVPTEIDPAIREAMDLEGKGGWRSGLGYDWDDAAFAARTPRRGVDPAVARTTPRKTYTEPSVTSGSGPSSGMRQSTIVDRYGNPIDVPEPVARGTRTATPVDDVGDVVPPPVRTLSDPRAAKGLASRKPAGDPRAAANRRAALPGEPAPDPNRRFVGPGGENLVAETTPTGVRRTWDDARLARESEGFAKSTKTSLDRYIADLETSATTSLQSRGIKPRSSSGISNPANYATRTPAGATTPVPAPRPRRVGTKTKLALGTAAVGAGGVGLNAARQGQFPWQKNATDAAPAENESSTPLDSKQATATREGATPNRHVEANGDKVTTNIRGLDIDVREHPDGSSTIELPDGSTRTVPAGATQDEQIAALDQAIADVNAARITPVPAGAIGGGVAAGGGEGTPAGTPGVVTSPRTSSADEFADDYVRGTGGGSSRGGSSRGYSRRSSSGRGGSRRRSSGGSSPFGEGFPFNRQDSAIRRQILAMINEAFARSGLGGLR